MSEFGATSFDFIFDFRLGGIRGVEAGGSAPVSNGHTPKNGVTHPAHPSALCLWHKYSLPPFYAFLVADVLVYRPLLCDEALHL